ncbi:MAG: UDP-N-acetylglucosamine 1-carboxyvinyltransferase [Chloroflexi bacterium]|nr:UDP-N-acetylglucosamine 1-carboxyvinyltransferase [Chloroflexota bacterium]
MSGFLVEGGLPLKGKVCAAANKNGVLPMLAATLLTDDVCVIHNVPRINAVRVMVDILKAVGAEITERDPSTLEICCRSVREHHLPPDLVAQERGTVLFMAPVLQRTGRVLTGRPGGCAIGRRDIATHLTALLKLGARVVDHRKSLAITSDGLTGTTVFLDEASVTATENTMMAATFSEGITVIKHAACEPHVVDFGRFLIAMGAEIQGLGSNVLTIQGGRPLHGAEYTVAADHIDIGTFAIAAAVTNGSVDIEGVAPENLEMICLTLERMGVSLTYTSPTCLHVERGSLVATRKIDSNVWPGFPTDLISPMITLATQCHGTTLVHDWMFESRMFFVDQLVNMGANIVLCDPHRCVVTGLTPLHGLRVTGPDLRAGMALLIAGLIANGTTEVRGAEQIERGYEDVILRLAALGAQLHRVD